MSYSDPAAGAAPGVAPAVTAAFQLLPAQELAMSVRLMGQAFALLANGFVLSRALTYALGRGRDDRRFFRALLAFVTFLEVLQTGMIFAAMHSSFIDNFGKPTALALPWMAATANILGSYGAFAVQLLFAYRIFILYKSHIPTAVGLVAAIVLCGVAGAIGSSTTGAAIIQAKVANALGASQTFRAKLLVAFIAPAAADIIISGLMLYKLRSFHAKSKVEGTSSMLLRIALSIVETNTFTAVFCTTLVVLYLADEPSYQAFPTLLLPVYVFTMLIALGVRHDSRDALHGGRNASSSYGPGQLEAYAPRDAIKSKVWADHVKIDTAVVVRHDTEANVIALTKFQPPVNEKRFDADHDSL